MSKLDLLKLMEYYGEETDLADFSPDELQNFMEKMQNDGEPMPMTLDEFKRKYFEYHDDVKDKSLKGQDW